ncbi:hypothetical protein WS75_25535 [Burkholderia sp. FL-7-2-10-S1-D7]|nr:hypothetical protein WS75_25535 [Burkholderia sp. FL-7-2-10-S1-D7]
MIKKIGLPVFQRHEQHEQNSQPFVILYIAYPEFRTSVCLMRFPSINNASVHYEQLWICRVVCGKARKRVDDLYNRERISHEVQQFGRKQIDDFGIYVFVVCLELI